MKTYLELLQVIQAGVRPVVTFQNTVDDLEMYAEAGMRARIVGITRVHESVKVVCDYSEFEAHNRTLESANYFGKDGVPNKTAREAGYYKPIDDFYAGLDQDIADHISLESNEALALFDAYKASLSNSAREGQAAQSYVQWLEQELLALRAGNA